MKFMFRTSDSKSEPLEPKTSCKILPKSKSSDEDDSEEGEEDGDSDAFADGAAVADAPEVKPFKIPLTPELWLLPPALALAFGAAVLVGPPPDDRVTSDKIESKSSPPLSFSTGTALAKPEAVINAIKYVNFILASHSLILSLIKLILNEKDPPSFHPFILKTGLSSCSRYSCENFLFGYVVKSMFFTLLA